MSIEREIEIEIEMFVFMIYLVSHTKGRGTGCWGIYGLQVEEVVERWRRLHSEELHNLYISPNTIRVIKSKIKWAGHVTRIGRMRNAYKILGGKTEGKRPCGRHRCWWEDNIRMNLREGVWKGVNWSHLIQDRNWWCIPVNMVMNL